MCDNEGVKVSQGEQLNQILDNEETRLTGKVRTYVIVASYLKKYARGSPPPYDKTPARPGCQVNK